ncbi:MAG: hypothetical protein HY259_07435 [Chloroflexi bacterium]|nr:hypothetical protein [Chloroflexota bacterium]
MGTPRPSISRVEARGVKDLSFARRLADALDCRLEVRFVPKEKTAKRASRQAKTTARGKKLI